MPFASLKRHAQYMRARYWQRPAAETPPGYIALSDAARILHYSQRGLYAQIRRGGWQGATYQRPDGGRWFLREDAVYEKAQAHADRG